MADAAICPTLAELLAVAVERPRRPGVAPQEAFQPVPKQGQKQPLQGEGGNGAAAREGVGMAEGVQIVSQQVSTVPVPTESCSAWWVAWD
mgnify:CR=1 FL=1